MTRGLVIGKFMPLHNGHIALINFAAEKCDDLIVSMSYTPQDPIDGLLRFSWIVETFKDRHNIKLQLTPDDFDVEHLPLPERTKIWASHIKQRMPPLDFIVSSEEYGAPFAENLGITHFSFDALRMQFPVSATKIRSAPFLYWKFIPAAVRPYYVKKICFYGPESTGKSSLAKYFAEKFQTEFVPEVARELLTSNEFTVDDIIRIGEGQTSRIKEKVKTANKLLFCDTDVITTEIYSDYYLHTIPPVLFELEKEVNYDLYFLLDVDIEWVADGLRDLGEKRTDMYNVFKKALDDRGIKYIKVSGDWDSRIAVINQKIVELYFNAGD